MSNITHLDHHGRSRMVDVSQKSATYRVAKARGRVVFPEHVFKEIMSSHGHTAKGSIVEVAKIAGLMAAKNTSNLIPMCHPMLIEKCHLDFSYDELTCSLLIESEVAITHKTGVEMEALTAVSIAALTVYDMTKALSHEIRVSDIVLVHKSGGKHDYHIEKLPEKSQVIDSMRMSQSGETINVNMQYFAQLREWVGKNEEVLTVPMGSTAAQVYYHLKSQYHFSDDIKQFKVAINHNFSDWDAILQPDDCIVFIPPVAGG